MGTVQCCGEITNLPESEKDLSLPRKSAIDNKARSADFGFIKSISKSSKGSKLQSKRNLQIKLNEINDDHNESRVSVNVPGELIVGSDVHRIVSGPELFAIQRSSQEFSNLPDSPGSPSSPHQTNYIVVVEADEDNNQDSDDEISKSRSLCCKSLEKALEDRTMNYSVNRSNHLGHDVGQSHRHDFMFSKNTIIQKQEKSIMQSRHQMESLNSGLTIEYSIAAGKTKDKLLVNEAGELTNLDRFSESKFVKAIIELDDFKDKMTKKFINATSVIQSSYIKVNLKL